MMMMEAQHLIIEHKHKQNLSLASLKDFTYREGALLNPKLIIDNPHISLYCLDDKSHQAIFVEVAPHVDLAKAAFVYQTQYEQAQQLIALPYTTFNQLAAQLPSVQQPIFVHTIGRSGSTLLHHAFNESQTVVSLSEADVVSQFANLRHHSNGQREAQLRQLAQSSVRFLFKAYHTQDVQAQVLKFHSFGLQVKDLFQAVFPQAKNIFLYRPASGFVASGLRIYQSLNRPAYASFAAWQSHYESFEGADHAHLAQYLAKDHKSLSLVQELTLRWIAAMEWYLAQVKRGIPALAVPYADLISNQEETLRCIFRHCGLPSNRVHHALRAYKRDAQAGTPLARKNPKKGNKRPLDQAQQDLMTTILQRHPVLNRSDFTIKNVTN